MSAIASLVPKSETEDVERDGRIIPMPKYDDGRRDDDVVEGELAPPAQMIEHEAATAEPAAIEEPEPPAPAPESASVRYERERVDKWIKDRLLNWPLASCLNCRRPFVAGDAWVEVASSAEIPARARFHRSCYAEWRAEREAAARQALGLEG